MRAWAPPKRVDRLDLKPFTDVVVSVQIATGVALFLALGLHT